MIRLVVPILILLLLLTGAVWGLRGFPMPELDFASPDQDVATPSANKPSTKQQTAAQPSETDNPNTTFDIARIDPAGVSVFAGRAEPGSRVTVMGDGQAVGSAKADENGEWTLATEHQFADADPKLALVTKSPTQVQAEEKAAADERAKAPKVAQTSTDKPVRSGATEVTSQLLQNLKGMVEEARNETQEKEIAAVAPTELPQDDGGVDVSTDDASPVDAAVPLRTEQNQVKSVPLPIMFVFNEATMTDEGREAASLLLQYLQLKHFGAVTLTGHADERGTDALNMVLSRERLDTVAQYLKDGGYAGQLTLIAKGETEPFMGVERDQYSQDDLYQLDRRVELVISP